MLFRLWPLITISPIAFALALAATGFALLTAVTVHEASHAFTARWQGDNLACGLGRCTLNPIPHLDPMGTVMMLAVGFGWGKPVPVRVNWLRSGPLTGGALVSLAGPASNFLFAAVASLPIRLGMLPFRTSVPTSLDPMTLLGYLLGMVVLFNVLLGVFNLLPIAPLDGFKVALGILPREAAMNYARLEPYGPGILMLLLMMGYLSFMPFGLGDILGPLVNFMLRLLVGF